MKAIIILLITALLLGVLNAQNPLLPERPSLESYEQWYLELGKSPDLRANSGWKYLARFVNEQSVRATHGKAPDLRILFRETERIANWEISGQPTRSDNLWSPAGPSYAPLSDNSDLIPGTGRINTITFHPTDPHIMWIGGGQGGIWKSSNRGDSWFPIGDQLPVMRVSDIAVNPNNPDEMYICLGDYAYLGFWIETNDRKRNTHFGMGVYKTTDGGDTWRPTGLTFSQLDEDASLTRRTFIDPEDDNHLIAAGIHGIWESHDRGDTWNRIFDEIIWDIEQHPNNPNILYASSGFIRNLNTGRAAIWKTAQFGESWIELNTGIPEQDEVQRIEIAISPVDPNVVYAITCDMNGGFAGLYRSTNGGGSWTLRSTEPNILHWSNGEGQGGQGTYDLAILADAHDVDKVFVGGVNSWVSTDGGLSWKGASFYVGSHGPSVHADHHMLAHNPHDDMIYLCHDGGVSRTTEILGGSWTLANDNADYEWPTVWEHLNEGLANLSFYRLGISQTTAGDVYAGAQDMGTFLRRNGEWRYMNLGDGMECIIHPADDQILYGSTQFGNLFASTNGGDSFFSLGNPWANEFAAWTTPFQLDPVNPEILYVPASNLWKTNNMGDTYNQLSDLDPFPVSAFSVSPANTNVMYLGKRIWYGLNEPGKLIRSDNGGDDWKDISMGTPVDSLYISFLETDNDDPQHVWACFGGFADGQKVFESHDGGNIWINISYNLPNIPANCIILHEGFGHHPIYLGMDRGVWYRNDTMDHWALYSEGLPNVVISDFDIHQAEQQLYISTFGRGVWMNTLMDKITTSSDDPFRQAAISVYPNPSDGTFCLDMNDVTAGRYLLEIVDVMGRNMHREIIQTNDDLLHHVVDLDVLSGLYYLRLKHGVHRYVTKVVIE